VARRIVARRGRFKVRLPSEERALLRDLLQELRAMLELPADDPRVRRLHVAAYAEDPEREAEYRGLTQDELRETRLAAVDDVEATLEAKQLTLDQLTAWMHAVNALRLVLGTILDVREDDDVFRFDPEDPDARNRALYGYLGVLLEEIVAAQLGE